MVAGEDNHLNRARFEQLAQRRLEPLRLDVFVEHVAAYYQHVGVQLLSFVQDDPEGVPPLVVRSP